MRLNKMKSIHRLVATIGLLLVVSIPSVAWTPKDLFRGKTGYVLSVVAVTAANSLDYHYTVQTVNSGRGHEANPLFLNNQGVLVKDRLLGAKIASGALIAGELWMIHKAPKYRPLLTIANYSVGSALGFQAYRGRQLFNAK